MLNTNEELNKTESLTSTLAKFVNLKAQIDALETELKVHKKVIEDAIEKSGGNSLEVGHFIATLSDASKENFSLKEARKTLDHKTVSEILTPFVSVTEYTQLRVKVKEV